MESLKTEKAGWLLKLGNSKIKQWRKRWIKVGEIENHIVYRANKVYTKLSIRIFFHLILYFHRMKNHWEK